MKLLLTSGGIKNEALVNALRELLDNDFKNSNLAFVPTAANVEEGDKGWLIDDLTRFRDLGFKEVDIVDIASVLKDIWEPRLKNADVLVFGGGNTSYLMQQIKKSGLAEALPELLETRVYVGISAGSMVAASDLKEKEMQKLYKEPIIEGGTNDGLGFVDFIVVPHMNSPHFSRASELVEELGKNVQTTLYALDDESAVKVVDEKIEVVSEGEWKRFN